MCSIEKDYFGPLNLHQKTKNPTIFKSDEPVESSCLLCDAKYYLPLHEKSLLIHLFTEHRLVIGDVNQIADLCGYLKYWRLRLKDQDIKMYCATMIMDNILDDTIPNNIIPSTKTKLYYLLGDFVPEDKQLRLNLQQSKLVKLLEHHTFEREDRNYTRECLFCRFVSIGTRASYLIHLYEKHNFHIAKPDNLIFVDQLVDLIASKLEKLQCIFCEGHFKDRNVLKEHMRKKGHKRINPTNNEYDKFYLVNYGGDKQPKPNYKPKPKNRPKRTTQAHKDCEQDSNADSDPDWSEWTESDGQLITCLICRHTEVEYDVILEHMERVHDFSFTKATDGRDFYHKIKIVNYIRRQIHLSRCFSCNTTFTDRKNLEKHLKEQKHIILKKEKWDRPEYYFSTYEDDLFLCFIQDDEEVWWSTDVQDVDRSNSMSDSISKEMAMAVLNE